MLSLARAKATAELVHVKQQTVEQDLRLQAAEQAFSHLSKVSNFPSLEVRLLFFAIGGHLWGSI